MIRDCILDIALGGGAVNLKGANLEGIMKNIR